MVNPGLYLAIHEISHHFEVDATVIHLEKSLTFLLKMCLFKHRAIVICDNAIIIYSAVL